MALTRVYVDTVSLIHSKQQGIRLPCFFVQRVNDAGEAGEEENYHRVEILGPSKGVLDEKRDYRTIWIETEAEVVGIREPEAPQEIPSHLINQSATSAFSQGRIDKT